MKIIRQKLFASRLLSTLKWAGRGALSTALVPGLTSELSRMYKYKTPKEFLKGVTKHVLICGAIGAGLGALWGATIGYEADKHDENSEKWWKNTLEKDRLYREFKYILKDYKLKELTDKVNGIGCPCILFDNNNIRVPFIINSFKDTNHPEFSIIYDRDKRTLMLFETGSKTDITKEVLIGVFSINYDVIRDDDRYDDLSKDRIKEYTDYIIKLIKNSRI